MPTDAVGGEIGAVSIAYHVKDRRRVAARGGDLNTRCDFMSVVHNLGTRRVDGPHHVTARKAQTSRALAGISRPAASAISAFCAPSAYSTSNYNETTRETMSDRSLEEIIRERQARFGPTPRQNICQNSREFWHSIDWSDVLFWIWAVGMFASVGLWGVAKIMIALGY